MIDKDRDERAKRVSQELVELERVARDEKTKRLRAERLAKEAGAEPVAPANERNIQPGTRFSSTRRKRP
jgi:hypothetical protein